MGRMFAAGLTFVGIVGLFVAPAMAHHTVAATVDVSRLVTLTGIVTSVEWKNPHVIYHLAVPASNGGMIDWEIESRNPDIMQRFGIEQDTIKAGQRVTMNVMIARDGSRNAATASIVLADGRTVSVCMVTNGACPS
jgi:hypothetical protein